MNLHRVAACVFALVVLAGCASTKVTVTQSHEGERIARPDRIIAHDFAANPADIPAGSAVAGQYAQHSTPETPKEIELGRQLAALVAKDLVEQIQGMGQPAVQAAGQPAPRIGDIVIMGYFESVDSGSVTKRIVLGFGSGTADLKTAVESYLMTDSGLRRLGSGNVDAAGGKAPGVAIPLVIPAQNAQAQVRLGRLLAYVQLYKSLGGGWNLKDPQSPPSPAAAQERPPCSDKQC